MWYKQYLHLAFSYCLYHIHLLDSVDYHLGLLKNTLDEFIPRQLSNQILTHSTMNMIKPNMDSHESVNIVKLNKESLGIQGIILRNHR